MPTLDKIQGIIDVDGLICSLAVSQALHEIEQYKQEGDDVAVSVLKNMLFALVDALEPIEE